MLNSLENGEKLYFLRIFSSGVENYQTEGMVFASKEEAWNEAVTSSAEILYEMEGKKPGIDWRMDVTDASGTVIYRLSFNADELDPAMTGESQSVTLAARQDYDERLPHYATTLVAQVVNAPFDQT